MSHPPRAPRRPAGPSPAVELLTTTKPAPVVIGTGLVALDVVYGPEEASELHVAAGGTCGNVLAGLAFLGWHAYPIARLANDGTGAAVREDLVRWGVRTDFLGLAPAMGTPVIVQRIRRDAAGRVSHRFSLCCQECGRWLPTYAAVPGAVMTETIERLPLPDVCFVDRASRGAVLLAEWAAGEGALVYAEPSGRSTPALLGRLFASAHIVKYSAAHRELVADAKKHVGRAFDPWLEVETLGEAGLRYRTRGAKGWRQSPSLNAACVRDTAGAGDWCSVGILHMLGQGGAAVLEHVPEDVLCEAISVGQALSTWTCQYEGARGGMYATTREQLAAAVERMLRRDTSYAAAAIPVMDTAPARVALCRDCTDEAFVI